MAYSYDEHMGEAQPAHMGSQSAAGGETQVAGDVININPILDARVKAADKAADKARPGWPPGTGAWAEGSMSAKIIPLKPGK